jgi:8-oxo-dGTP diphosphatase
LSPRYIEQIEAKGSSTRDSRGWSVTLPHISLIGGSDEIVENRDIAWSNYFKTINEFSLPFDHNELLLSCFNVLLNKAKYTSILLYLLNDKFTISEAVEIFKYFDLKVSKQTIYNRWVKAGLIKETGEFSQNAKGGKPAALYGLCEKELSYFDIAIGSV